MKPNRHPRLFAAAALALGCSLLVLGLPAAAQPARDQGVEVVGKPGDDARLRWAPPPLANPTTITLGDGPTYTRLNDDQDYVIQLPKTRKLGATVIEGGRNVVIMGGYITVPPTSDNADAAQASAIYIKDNVGVVHIEGVLIDASGRGMSDGIDIASPRAVVQIENVRVDGVFGFHNQFHAHVIKPFGGVAALRVDKLTGYSGYQGLTLDTELGPIGSADISRVNLVAIRKQVWGPNNNGGQMIWMTREPQCQTTYPVRFGEVYLAPRAGTPLAKAVWPMAAGGSACPATTTGDDAEVAFPALPVAGTVERGLPPKGDFVPEGVAGVGYASPGYQPARPGAEDWIAVLARRATSPATRQAAISGSQQAHVQTGGY